MVKVRGYIVENISGNQSLEKVAAELRRELASRADVCFHREIGSTNSWLKHQYDLRKVLRPTLVLTDRQTAGRGTRGRDWTQAGRDLALTAGVIMPAEKEVDQRLSLAVGALTAVVIESVSGLATRVKWPNDVLTAPAARAGDWLKVCGILIETVVHRGERLVLAGVGVNVNSSTGDYPPPISDKLTTLRDSAGVPIDRAGLARRLGLELLDGLCGLSGVEWPTGDESRPIDELISEWLSRDVTAGSKYLLNRDNLVRQVTARLVDQQTCGLVCADEQNNEYIVTSYTELAAPDEP